MPMKLPNITIPTGYESQQRAIERKRRIAELLMQRGLQQNQGMRSPLEAIGQVTNAFLGKRAEKKSDEQEAALNEQIRTDYTNKLSGLNADINAGMTAQAIRQKYGNDPLLADKIKPYDEAFASGLKADQDYTTFNGRRTRNIDVAGKFDPGNPTDSVLRDPSGNFIINPAKVAASQVSQMVPADNASAQALMATRFNPNAAGGTPAAGSAGAGGSPSSPGMDLSLLSPEEKQVMANELKRRSAMPPAAQGMHGTNGLKPPPSGVLPNGKPYWMVNGVPYDNPEGN